jgi:hypothetical protein
MVKSTSVALARRALPTSRFGACLGARRLASRLTPAASICSSHSSGCVSKRRSF